MFNCGMAAIELPKEKIDALFAFSAFPDSSISVDVASQSLTIRGGGREEIISFDISPFDKALVLAGGWVDYADQKY